MVQTSNAVFHTGELARVAGISPDTIRHYERIGILPKARRTASGYRVYTETTLQRICVVQRALRIGFTLAELADIFKTRDAGGAPCERVLDLARQKLKRIREDIVALQRTERYIQDVLQDWDSRVRRAGRGQRAHLLQTLTDAVKDAPGVRRFGRRRR
jgi:DNA-binding transcriptional MerR regulator